MLDWQHYAMKTPYGGLNQFITCKISQFHANIMTYNYWYNNRGKEIIHAN